MYARRARGQRFFGIDHRRQGLVVDFDQVDGIASHVAVARHHSRHRFADVADLVHSQAGVIRYFEPLHTRGAGNQPHFAFEISPRVDRDDSGMRARRRHVDRLEAGVGVHAPGKGHVQHTVELHVVNVVSAPLNESWIFLALDPFP